MDDCVFWEWSRQRVLEVVKQASMFLCDALTLPGKDTIQIN
jgi:hypothetical protein